MSFTAALAAMSVKVPLPLLRYNRFACWAFGTKMSRSPSPSKSASAGARPSLTLPTPAAAVTSANITGVAVTTVDHTPVPKPFTAATRRSYAVPFTRPVTVADVVVEVPSANVVHVPDGLVRNCTT